MHKLTMSCLKSHHGLKTAVRSLACNYSRISKLRDEIISLDGGSVDLMKDENSGIATVMMNNPGKKNAMSGKMMIDFHDCVSELEKWSTGRAVILAGAHNTFCSGGDLQTIRQLIKSGDEIVKFFAESMHDATSRLFDLPMVSVAAIAGHAMGGGAELATACDFRLMTDTAQVEFWHVKINVLPAFGGCFRLVKLLGRTKALQLLSSSKIMNAETALQMGFVNEIVDSNKNVLEVGQDWLRRNCIGDTGTVKLIKQMVVAVDALDGSEAYEKERELFLKSGVANHTGVV